jgi:hypothetical protein
LSDRPEKYNEQRLVANDAQSFTVDYPMWNRSSIIVRCQKSKEYVGDGRKIVEEHYGN